MVVNHLEKLFVTNDAATILKELEVNVVFCYIFCCSCYINISGLCTACSNKIECTLNDESLGLANLENRGTM